MARCITASGAVVLLLLAASSVAGQVLVEDPSDFPEDLFEQLADLPDEVREDDEVEVIFMSPLVFDMYEQDEMDVPSDLAQLLMAQDNSQAQPMPPLEMFGGAIWNPLDDWMDKQIGTLSELQSMMFDSRPTFPMMERMPLMQTEPIEPLQGMMMSSTMDRMPMMLRTESMEPTLRMQTRPFMQMGAPVFVDIDFEEADTDRCLHAVAQQRLPAAMKEMDEFLRRSNVMGTEELLGAIDTRTNEAGASWSKTSGTSNDGATWMAFTMTDQAEPNASDDFPEALRSTIESSQEFFRRSQEQMQQEEMQSESLEAHHHHHHHRHHRLACVAGAVGLAALMGIALGCCCFRPSCSQGAAYPYPCARQATLEEPLLASQPQMKKSTSKVVVAAEYVNLSYVPLKGEEDS